MHETLAPLQAGDPQPIDSEGICLKIGFFSPEAIRELRETTLRMRPLSMEHRNPPCRWILLSLSYAPRKPVHELTTCTVEVGRHVLSVPAGTLLMFDDRGVPRTGERSILCYNSQPTKYWKRTHTPVRYALILACRACLPGPLAVN